MATCADCVHVEVCREYVEGLAAARGVRLSGKELDSVFECDDCKHFKDRSQFVELPRGYWKPENTREKSTMYLCSLCGGKAYDRPCGSAKRVGKKSCSLKFCPNCGARMNKKAEQALKERENGGKK